MSNDTSFRFPNAAAAIREPSDAPVPSAKVRFPNAAPVEEEVFQPLEGEAFRPLEGEVVEAPTMPGFVKKPKKVKKPRKVQLTESPHLLQLTDATIHQAIDRHDVPVMVCFSAPWCIPCKQISVYVIALAHEFADKASIAIVDLKDADMAVRRFAIQAVPTTLIFHQGQEVARFVGGNTSVPKLRALLRHAHEKTEKAAQEGVLEGEA
jgi:thioredoxin 1